MSDVCVIVVTYNGVEWLDKCLGSIKESKHPADVVVVDNGSIDGTLEFIYDNYPAVQVFEQQENLGFGKANNVGLTKAYDQGYEYFFLLNQDAWVEPNVIENLRSFLQSNPEFGVVSPIHLQSNGAEYDDLFYKFVKKNLPSGNFLERKEKSPECCEIKFVNAAAWMLSRDCLEQVGLFHPLFFHYGEDSNYLKRVRWNGLKVGLLSQSFIFHDREDRGFNHLKDAPENSFQRESLKALLYPQNVALGSRGRFKAFYQAYLVAKGLPFGSRIGFLVWAFRRHSENIKQFVAFQNAGSPGLYLK